MAVCPAGVASPFHFCQTRSARRPRPLTFELIKSSDGEGKRRGRKAGSEEYTEGD